MPLGQRTKQTPLPTIEEAPMKTRRQAWLEKRNSRRVTRSQGLLEAPPALRRKSEPKEPPRKRARRVQNEEPGLMRDLWAALRWMRDNQERFRGSVAEPSVLSMDEEGRRQALKTALESDFPEDKDPFLFVFQLRDDMDAFLDACADKQGLRICCMFTETVC